MIHGISANQPTFHTVRFTQGLNVILAERTKTSTQKDTRNGVGKSTLIDIIHFCMGATAKKGKGLIKKTLEDWVFSIDITLAGNRVKATRAVQTPNWISISGSTDGWVEQPDFDEETGEYKFNLDRWKNLLGWALFDLMQPLDTEQYKPSYRSLFSYFVRVGHGAFTDPFRHFAQQPGWSIQLNIAYLLGLNWEQADQWRKLKVEEDRIKAFDRAIKTGAMGGIWGTLGQMEVQRIHLEQEVKIADNALGTFKVHPQYKSIQTEADNLTSELHDLLNRNVSKRLTLAKYIEAVSDEIPPRLVELEKVYEEAGIVFPKTVCQTLSDAKRFHECIIENRRAFLENEIERLKTDIADREKKIEKLTDSRAELFEILQTHGALQEMNKLQERSVELKGQLDRVRSRIEEIKNLNVRKRNLIESRTELAGIAEQDYEQRREVWTKAVLLFNSHSQALYNSPGNLMIDIGDSGYKYQVDIERSDSEGISKMKVFCFDLMLLQIFQNKHRSINFLVHDSALHDGVDSRQRAMALERAARITREEGTQYICALNSDSIPSADFSERFNFDQYIRLKLTDREQSGSLLGIKF